MTADEPTAAEPAVDSAAEETDTGPAGPVMRVAFAYERFADGLSEVTGAISTYAVLVTIAVGLVNVVLRYVGELTGDRLTNSGLIEAQWYLYSLIFLFGFGYILKHQINMRVDFWFAEQPPTTKAWIDLIGHLVALIPFCIVGIWFSWDQVLFSWSINEQSPHPSGLPRAPIKTMIIVAFVILLIQAVAEVIRNLAIVRGIRRPKETTHESIRIE